MKREKQLAYLSLGLVSILWGTTYVAARIGAQQMPGFFVAGLRQFFSGLVVVAYFLARGYKMPEWSVIRQLSVQGILLLCIANGLITWSMEYISGGLAAIIVALVPLFVAFFTARLCRHQQITRWMIVGWITGFAGIVVIFYDYLGALHNTRFVLGVVLAFISVLSWSYGTVYAARTRPAVDILFSAGLQMLIAGVIMLLICVFTGQYVFLGNASRDAWLALLYLVVFGSLIAYSAYAFALSKLPATQVSLYAYINPIVAVGLGWAMLSEEMNLQMLMGALITLTGVYLVNHEIKKQQQ